MSSNHHASKDPKEAMLATASESGGPEGASLPTNEAASAERVDRLNEMAERVLIGEDPKEMLKLGAEACAMAQRLHYPRGEAYSQLWTGVALWFTSDLERALSTLLEAKTTFGHIGDPLGAAKTQIFIGSVFRSLGDNDQAFLEVTEAADYFRTAGDPLWDCLTRLSHSFTCQEIGDFEGAMRQCNTILELLKELPTDQGQWIRGRALLGIGAALSRMGKHREAFQHVLQSLNVCRAAGHRMGEARALQELGIAHERLSDREKAFRCYTEGLALREEIHQREAQCTSLISLGNFFKKEDSTKAIAYLERALALATEIGSKPRLSQTHRSLSDVYEICGDLAQAIVHLKHYQSIQDEIFEEKSQLRVKNLKLRFETEKREKEEEIARLKETLDEGAALGGYRMVERLGSGGMGEVWRGQHRLLARAAAVKVIRTGDPNSAAHKELAKRFQREAQVTASLRSPHTVHLYDFGVSETGAFYYVMELLDGMDLRAMVETHGPIMPERAVMLLRQACRSLEEAHERGLVHRDIKPANLYVSNLGTEYDFLKVLDFGMVKATDEGSEQLTNPEIVVGTPAFVAPELIQGEESVDGRADLYSLGCTAFWMLTGKCVFPARTPTEMLVHHIQSKPPKLSEICELEIPESLQSIVLRCLEKRPGARPASARELWELLGTVDRSTKWTQERAREWWRQHAPAKVLC